MTSCRFDRSGMKYSSSMLARGQAFATHGSAQFRFALATSLSSACKQLDIELHRDSRLFVERIGNEGGVDHEGRAMQRLRRPEHRSLEGMRDHDVVTNFDTVQRRPPQR